MKHFWLLLALSAVIGTTCAWAMNYRAYGHRQAFFGEITTDGTVTADNVMEKLREYHKDSSAKAELQSDPRFDFGAMAPGDKGSHQFVVKNIGQDVLRLELGATTCKCTLGSLKSNELAPGESTPIVLEWTVAEGIKNSFEQSAELRTSDPLQPAIRLIVQGLVIDEVEFEPKQIPFGEVLAGEPFEFSTKLYNYYNYDIQPISARFGSDELTELSNVEFERFELSEADGVHKRARQAFLITAKVQPGLRQGPIVTNLQVTFKKLDQSPAPAEIGGETVAETGNDPKSQNPNENLFVTVADCAGRVIGALTMIETTALRSTDGGGYIWSLGRVGAEDNLEFRAHVALKGTDRDSTILTIGETFPSDVMTAEIGSPLGKGQMRLFPITVKLKPGQQPIDLLGKNKDDFGWLWIESDNPKVSRMKIAVKVFLDSRP